MRILLPILVMLISSCSWRRKPKLEEAMTPKSIDNNSSIEVLDPITALTNNTVTPGVDLSTPSYASLYILGFVMSVVFLLSVMSRLRRTSTVVRSPNQ